MLALSETDGRRHAVERNKIQNKGKKRSKHEKSGHKRTLLTEQETAMKEELTIHELMPVPYKPVEEQELGTTTVTFDPATVTQPDCQSLASVSCMNSVVSNSNKFVIITLLEPEMQGITGEEFMNDAEITDENKSKCTKLQKKVLLLHKIDAEPTPKIQKNCIKDTISDTVVEKVNSELDASSMTINFSDFESPSSDGKDQKDIGNWIQKFPSLSLHYLEAGKPYVKCPACTAMFFKAVSFEKHVSCHLREQGDRYVCNFCKYDNEDSNTIFNHLIAHQDQCEVCYMNLTRKNSFKKHWEFAEMTMTFTVKRDRWGRFVCIYCKLGFDLFHQLQKHWFKHSCNSPKTSQCNNCSGLFDTDEALQNHICLKCPVCGKICDSVHRLRSHTRYEKHYLYCQICLYEFILSVDHEKHMALHKKIYHSHKDYAHCMESEDSTSFQCEICGKIYHTMSILVLHIHDDHKVSDTSQTLENEQLVRISLPDVKDGTSYDIMNTLKNELKCKVDFERACEVLETQADRSEKKTVNPQTNEGVGEKSETVALCWNRYEIDDQSTMRKAT